MQTEAQKRATKKWKEKNKDKVAYYTSKSRARNFLTKKIQPHDIDEFIGYLENLKNLKENAE